MRQNTTTSAIQSITRKAIFFFSVLLVFSACTSEQDDFSGIEGTKAPAFSLYSTEGKRVNLFDFKDKVIVLYFFGNNSPECKATSPMLEEMLVSPYAGREDYVVLGLDYWNGDPAAVKAFKNETGIDIPMLLDAGNVGTNYKTFYNRIVVIDQEKNIVFSGTQDASKDIPSVKVKIDNLLER